MPCCCGANGRSMAFLARNEDARAKKEFQSRNGGLTSVSFDHSPAAKYLLTASPDAKTNYAMNCTVEPTGNIVLKTSPKEASIIAKALVSKNLILRKEPVNTPVCNEILAMSVRLDSALVESNRTLLNRKVDVVSSEPGELVKSLPRPKGLWKRIRNFFDAPFYTSEYENAHTRSGVEFSIDAIIYSNPMWPEEAYGTVIIDKERVSVIWNDRGKCISKGINDVSCYDLIRPNQKERNINLSIGIAFVLILIALFLLSQIQ